MINWRRYFPFPNIRNARRRALDFIVKAIDEGADDIFLILPTGTGKNPIAVTITEMCGSGYITTANIGLENQYMDDFASMGLRQIHAKDHYPCPEHRNRNCRVGNGHCTLDERTNRIEHKLRDGKSEYTPELIECPYRDARYVFFNEATSGISNAAYSDVAVNTKPSRLIILTGERRDM